MEPPDPSFADEFNVPHEDAVLVFDVRRAAVSLTHVRVSSLRTKSQKKLSPAALRTFRSFFSSHLYGLSKVAVVGFGA